MTALVHQLPTPTMDRADAHPVTVYLAALAPGSRRTMRGALISIAKTISPMATEMTLPWADLRYQHTQAVRALLLDRYSAATTNKMLSALRGVMRECWRLGLMTAEVTS